MKTEKHHIVHQIKVVLFCVFLVLVGLTAVWGITVFMESKRPLLDLSQRSETAESAGNMSYQANRLRFAVATMVCVEDTFCRYQRLISRICRAIGSGEAFVLRPSYAEVRQGLEDGKVDVAFVCTGTYIHSLDRGRIKLLVQPEFMAGLDDAMGAGDILKRGNTCFVSRIQVAGKDIVVKRYNYKGLWHSLRHTLKGSRAKKCWLFGHRLRWLSVPVAEPLAYIELRHCGIIRQSYILNKYIDGQNVLDYINHPRLDEEARQEARDKTYALLDQIAEHKVTHGDLKATNILICDDQPVLIDLDSMKRHRCRWLLKLYQRKMQNKLKGQSL